MNRLKSKACKGFLFNLNHDELVYFSSLAKIQGLTYVSVIFCKERKQSEQEAPRSIMGRRATDVNHLAFSVAKVLQKETGTLGQVPIVGCQPSGLRMQIWFKWIKLGLPATYCLKQEVVLLYQDLELIAKRSLSRLASCDFVMSGKFSPLPAK